MLHFYMALMFILFLHFIKALFLELINTFSEKYVIYLPKFPTINMFITYFKNKTDNNIVI